MIRNVLSFNELKKFCTGATLTAGSGCFSAESPAEGSPLASGEAPFIGECCVAVNERSVRENCAAGLFAFWAKAVAVVMLCVMAMSGQGWALSQVGGVYQIGSCKDLKDFSDLVNEITINSISDTACIKSGTPKITATFTHPNLDAKLTKDIDDCNGIAVQPIGGNVTYTIHYSQYYDYYITSGCNAKTRDTTLINKYSGTFDGDGHTISNLNISSSSQYVGLFGYVDGGTIKNVKVENSTITRTGNGTSKEYYTGVIVGYLESGTVTGVATEKASVAGSDVWYQNWSSGGIAGYNGGTISECSVVGGTIKGRTEVGGIAGTNAKGGTITDCLASPDVLSGSIALETGIGGIAGKNDGTISRVVYTGDRVSNTQDNSRVTGGPITGSGSKDCIELCFYTENVGLQPTGGDAQESDIEKIKETLGAPWDVADEDLIVVNEIYYYTVTIKPNGRGSEQTISVKKNQKIESLDSIMVGGFKRIGLCKDAGCTQKWNLANDQVSADITLYAEWAQAYTVTFTIGTLADGETGSFPSGATTVKYCVPGEKITADGITSPNFASGVLAGWSRADDGTVDADLGTMGSEAVTVYAIENISNVVIITYKPGTNGTGSVVTQKAVPGATINLKGNLFTRTSYAQDGWSTNDKSNASKAYDLNQSITVPNDGLTLYPHWKSTSVKIEYKYSESSAADPSGNTIAAAYKAEDTDFNLTNEKFTQEGYRQDGWSLVYGGNKSYDMGAPYNVNQPTTFYPHWIQVFSVTFDANGHGSAPEALSVDAGSKIAEPVVPTAEGYTFNGWNTSADGTGTTWDFNTNTVTANTTLYAMWRANNFTITYNKGEFGTGSIVAGTKTPGVAFMLSSYKFTRSGYEQVGWATQDGSQTFELGGSYTTDADITLYPVWKQLFTVTFNANGQGEAPESQSVLDGEKATAPTAPTATGYTFNGWNTKQDGTGSTWNFGTNTVTETTTLYAMWTINTYTVTYEYSLDGTTYQQQGDVDNVTYNAANVEVRNTYMVDGYTMSAWATEDVEVTDGKFTMPAKNVVFRATGTKKNFTITYFIGDTQAGDAVSVEFGGTITPKDTSKTGYAFSGWTWYSLADASNPVQLEESPKAMPAYNLKAVGTFAPTQYTATFDANEGVFAEGAVTSKLVDFDAAITAEGISEPTRTGYVFKGWSRTQTATAADEKLGTMNSTEGVTIYAVWVQTFTVTFNKNGHGSDVETQTVESGSNVVKPDDLSETGYTFAGWFTDDGTFENAYEFSSAVTADVTLYAKWTANSYTVTYKITGDYFATEEFETSSASFADVVNVTTKSTDKDGYTFSGWSISEGGVTILNDQFTMGTANVVLTGSYTLNSYTITYNGVDGAINPNTATSYTVESENITLQAATKAGYAFAGWYDNAEFSGDAVTQIAKGTTGNKTFYAKWTAIPVVVTIEGNSETKTYNGESQSVNGYTVKSISCDGYTCTDFTADNVALKSGVTAVASGTDASTTPYLMGLNNTSFETKNTAYTNVTFSVTDGSLTINQASDLSVTLERASFTYDGSAHALTAAATTNAKGGTTKIEYQFDGDTEWTEALASLTKVAAGTYTVNVRATNPNYSNIATNSATLEISAATITITAADQYYTYTGAAQGAPAAANVEGATISYKVGEGEWSTIVPTLTAADTVEVTVKAEKANYTTATKTFSFGVAKAPVTVAAENKEQVYGAEAATLTATVTGKPESGAAVNYTLARGEGANVGTYAINVTLGENPNYEITTTAGTYTITKKAVVVKATAASKTYGETDPELTSSVEGLVTGESETLIVRTLARAEGEDVGTYTITPSGETAQGNYSVSYEPAKFTINQLEATLSWTNTEFDFDGETHVPTATVSNLVGTDACTVTVTGAASAAGEHTATATALSNTNYKLPASVTQTFNIKAGAFAVTLSENKTYNGEKQTPTVTVKDGGKMLKLGTDYTVAWDNDGFTNAGDYKVTVTGKGNYTGSETATYTILKKTATIAVDAASKTYGEIDPTFTGKVEGLVNDADLGTIAYVRTDATTDVNVGTYTDKLTATFTENANYTVSVTPATFTINQLEATLSWSNVEFDYDGAEHVPTATVSNLVGTDACTVTVTGAASAAGEHTATATALSNANYKLPASVTQTFNIKAGAFAVTLSENKTYNGTKQTPTVTVKDGTKTLVLDADYTVAWDNDGFTNAGDYKVTVIGKGNYTGSETATYTILKKAATIAVDAASKTYGEIDPTFTGKVEGLVNDADLGTIAYVRTDAATDVNAGTYTDKLTATFTENANYTVTVTPADFTIDQLVATLAWTGTEFNFDGAEHVPTATVSNLVGTDACTVTVTGAASAAGEHTATATALSNANYKLPASTTQTFNIKAGAFAVTLSDNVTYNGTKQTPTVTVKDGGKMLELNTDYTVAWDNDGFTNAGDYKVTVTGKGNYTGSETATYTILKKTATIAVDAASKTFGEIDPTFTGKVEGLVNDADLGTIAYVRTDAATDVNAGTYTDKLTATFTENANYTVSVTPATFTIDQLVATLAWTGTEFNFDGETHVPTATVSNLVGTDACTVTVTGAASAAGEHTATATALSNANYKLPASVTQTFNIKAGAFAVTLSDNVTYNGEKQTPTVTVKDGAKTLELNMDYTVAWDNDGFINAGDYKVTVTGKGNYTGSETATYTILKKAATIAVDAASKTYGEIDPTFTGKVEGLVNDADLGTIAYVRTDATTDVNVGTYTDKLTATFTENANYTVSVTPATFTIDQLVATLSWTNTEFDFDGEDHVPTATVSNLVGTDACTVTVTGAASAAGEHTATATALSNANYKLPTSATQKFNIKAGAFAVTLSDNVTYNGEKQTPTVTVKDGTKTLELGTDYIVAWDNDGFTNAGDYKVTVTGKGNYTGSETATYTILKKAATIAVDAASKTYGEIDPTFTGKVEGLVNDADLGTIAYVRMDAATDVNAGTYTNKLTATYTENANYTVSVTPATFTIDQLEATLSWSNVEFDYDGAEHVPTATVSNLVGTDACTVTVTGAASAAGEHTATATALSNTNYKLPASTTQTFNIKAGAFAVTLSENKTYNGTKQTPTVTVKDGGKMLELGTDYTVAWDNDGFTNAGDYKVTVTGKGNYTGSETATYTISKKTATIAVDAASKTYGEIDPTFTATVAGTVGEDNVVYTLTRVEGENVGTYTITASGEASQGNYSVTYETATFTIAKATVNTVTVAIDGWTFGESAKTPTASATFKADGEPVVTYAVKGSDSWSATAPTAAGEYTVKATVAETDNYVGGSATKDFTIVKAGFTVAGTNYEDVYDGASHGIAAVPTVTEGTTVSYSTDNGTTWSTTAPTIKDVGEISVSVKAENANYETATTTYTLKVTKRAITLVSASDRKFYDGTALTASTVIVSEGSYANGESFQYNVTGSQIEVGASENTFTYSATSSESSAKVENYEVTLVKGKLTVDPVVTFVMNGHGTQVDKQNVLTGEKATEPTEPSAEGYTFGGWFTDNETFANAYDFTAAVNENKTLYAKWTVNRYTVTWWKSEEKRQAHDQKTDVPFDSVITAPTKDAPTKQGYLFDKWTSTDVTVAEDGSFTMPAKAVDVVPTWTLETYNISYELNGGTNAVSNPATYNFETETFNFADPTRDGFVFLGWYGESDFSGEKITGVEKGSVGNMTLYAYWANDAYTITYNPGKYGEGGLAAGKKVYGKPFTLSADDKFTRVGYTQTGWTTTDGGSQVYAFGDSYTTDADITLYPVWRINTHSVTFKVGEKIIRYDGEVTYGMEVTAPTAPDSLGYTFAQWQSDNEGISSLGVNGKFNMIDEDVVAKALYWVDTYKLTYDLDDGTCVSCHELTGYKVTEKVTLPTDVEKTGYTFGGWFNNDKFEGRAVTEIAKGSTGDKKFYAKWTINNYTITYKITGDYFKNDAFVTDSADFGMVVDTTTTSTVQEGYTFSGWSVAEGGVTLENGKFTMGTANVVLTGSYSINSYDVVWKKDDATYSSSSVAYGVEVVAPATAPTKNGYDFAGWTTSDVTLADDYSFTMPAKAVTLNADWNLVTYEIAYESNGGEAVPSSNYTIESADITLPTTTRLGYDFGGWFDNEDLSGTAVTKVAAGSFGNKKFYAKWDVVTYNITYTGLGDMTHENPVTYTVEDAVVLTDPTDSTGYSFDGWYIGEDKVTSIAKGSTGAKTIVAKWSPKNVEFKVVYELYGATGSKEKTMDEVTLEGPADAPIIDNITWKDFGDGYDYELVYINDVEHNKSYFTDKIARDGSTVVKVRVEHNEFTFTFYTEGESGWKKWDEQPLYYGYDEKENYNVKAPTAPTKTGYTFVGWCADAETCESVQTFPMNVPAKNMKFYPKWTINPYTITFDTKGGSTVVAITQDYNTAVAAPENPTRTGYLFAGWDKEIPATMPAEDITITAKWDMDVKASGYTGVYDGDAHGITVTAPEGATITYSTAEDGDYVAALTYADVGTYTVYYKASQEGYADVKGSATVAITPATMTLVVAGYADTYDGAAHSGTATPSVTEGTTVSYSTDNGTTWSTTAPTIKDVGEISVSVKAENANYETATNSYTLKVTPKAVVVKATAAQKTYGETDPTLTTTVEGTLGEDKVEYSLARATGENVGEYAITASGNASQGNYSVTYETATFTIARATTNNVTVAIDGWTYGVSASVPTATADFKAAGEPVITYAVKGSDSWSATVPTAAGEYTVKAAVAETKNYVGGTATKDFTIAKKSATITVAAAEKTYGDADPEFTGKVEGLVAETDLGEITYFREGSDVNVGTYTDVLTVTFTANDNYNVTIAKGVFTIGKRSVTFTGEDDTREYTGSEIELTNVTVGDDGLLSGHTHNVTYSAKGIEVGKYNGVITNAADVKIMAGETDVTSNYDIATYAMALDIKPAGKFTIALANDTTTYDGAPHNNVKTAVSEAVSGTTTFQYQFEGDGETWVGNLEDLVKVNAGEYIINVKATNTNYADMATTTAKLTIIPKTATVSAVDAGKTLGSKDPELLATITGVVGEDKLEYVVARDEGENVGYYQIAPVGAENQGNYRVAYEPARFTISPVVKVVLAKGMELICTESECDADGNIKYTYGKETMLPAAKVSDDESWIFQGLFENEKLAGTPVTKISADVTKNVTLYPNFTKNIIAKTDSGIVFIAKDMDDTQDSLNRKVTVAARVAFPLPRKSSDGLYSYRFTEYAYNAETDVYEAQFVGVPQKFLVTFNLPEGAVLSTEIETYTYGETTKLPTASIKGAEDWEFKGWYTKPDGNGTRVKAISAGEFGEKTLYPLFQKTIAYDANGARGEVSAIYAENAEMVINAALADVVPQDYVKKGKTYTFDKWVLENGTYVAKFTQTDALKAASVPHFTVSVMNRVLEISGARMGAKVAVFDMRGTLVASGIVENGTQRVEIAQPGSYIVRVNNQVRRVNVR